MAKQENWQSDWKKADSISDDELESMVKNDPDDVYLHDDDTGKGKFFQKGEWVKQFEAPQKKIDYPSPGFKSFLFRNNHHT